MRPIFLLLTLLCSALAVSQDLGAGGRPVGPDYSRSPVYGKNGMAATAQPLASQVALDILQKGGSAVDAAIAANAALGLMEPTGNGIGGDLFAIIWDPKTETLYGYNGSGRAPMGRDLQDLKSAIQELKQAHRIPADYEGIASHGSLSVTVPGTVDGWFAMHERFGSIPMSKILEPAINYARDGFPVSSVIAYYFERNLARFRQVAPMIEELDNAMTTYFEGGKAPAAGELFRNPDLANTLALLAEEGRSAFYSGKIAQTIDTYMNRIGGDLRLADLEAHRGEWVTPLGVDYKGYTLYELPPNGQGLAALIMLSILKNVDLTQWDRGSPEVLHYMVEAKRLAFADMAASFADPDFAEIPTQQLISDEYGKRQFQRIDPKRAANDYGPSQVLLEGEGDTTYLTVADESGMMVSLIQSNYRGMGSGLVPDGLGFMLQDRGELFALTEGHPNVYAPGKRPFHTIIPAFLMQGDKPVMSFGLMGGGMQPQGHVQVLINWLDYGMDIQAAGDAARFLHDGGASSTNTPYQGYGVLYVEPGVPEGSVARLREMGHQVEYNEAGAMFGGYQAIYKNPETGVYSGATEMRKDGTVTAY